MKINLAQMTEYDLDAVLRIERISFSSPWTKKLFLDELANPLSHIVLAKDEMDTVLGFVCFWIVLDEAHILRIVVHPELRRQGIAKSLLSHVLDYSKSRGVRYFALEVRQSNKAAIAMYKGFGFKVIYTRKGYYGDTGEDAVLMELELA